MTLRFLALLAALLSALLAAPSGHAAGGSGQTLTLDEMNRQVAAMRKVAFADPDKKPFKLASLKGKLVWLNQWAHWCGPCIAEFDAMKKAQAALGRDKLEIVLVSRPQFWEADRKFAKAKGLDWPMVVFAEPNADLMRRANLVGQAADTGTLPNEGSVPVHTLLGKDGHGLLVTRGAPSSSPGNGAPAQLEWEQAWFIEKLKGWAAE
jgi:thiol-disulfide isomerase/thioredoxin